MPSSRKGLPDRARGQSSEEPKGHFSTVRFVNRKDDTLLMVTSQDGDTLPFQREVYSLCDLVEQDYEPLVSEGVSSENEEIQQYYSELVRTFRGLNVQEACSDEIAELSSPNGFDTPELVVPSLGEKELEALIFADPCNGHWWCSGECQYNGANGTCQRKDFFGCGCSLIPKPDLGGSIVSNDCPSGSVRDDQACGGTCRVQSYAGGPIVSVTCIHKNKVKSGICSCV
ncbi:MAG: hypothetical protein KDD70_16385 [Bdellovibrionales bacterium]|nr:hypothetical protein [Bdellovibrionales bacterium]